MSMLMLWKKRTLLLLGLALLGSGVSGCIGGDDNAAFLVTWDSVYVGTNRAARCDRVGTPRVQLRITNLTTREEMVDTFNCDAGQGQSRTLPTGRYYVVLALVNQSNEDVSAIEGEFNISRRGFTDLGDITFQVQAFVLNWSLARNNMGVSCADVGARTVRLITRRGTGNPVQYEFPCDPFTGSTTAVPVDTYSVQVQLWGADTTKPLVDQAPFTFPVPEDRLAEIRAITFNVP